MLRSRIVPCLLIQNGGLVKTQMFKSPKYVGDPINAIKIFNEKEADELIVLDIDATANKAEPNYKLITKLAAECRMPLCYGGGISNPEQAFRIIDLGVEKVAISSAAINNPEIVTKISEVIGRQSVVVVLDIFKKMGLFTNSYEVFTNNGKFNHKLDPFILAKILEEAGAGEIVINSINNDGCMMGYDLELSKQFCKKMKIPVTILGGAGSYKHISSLIQACGIIGVGVGSLFVFKGKYRAVLINYPSREQKDEIFQISNML